MELRCGSRMHGIVDVDAGFVEVRCKSALCGHASGVVVIHRFSLADGQLIESRKFQDPIKQRSSNASRNGIPVRSA